MSFFSAGTFVAWGSIAYQHGWVAVTIQWTMCIGALVTGFFLAPRWKATGNLTAAEFIRDRLGERVQKLFIFIFTLVSVFIKGSVLYPVAKLVSVSLGFPLTEFTIVLGLFMISYTAIGGLWAVMVTDILQFVILTAAVAILLPLALGKTGAGQNLALKIEPGLACFSPKLIRNGVQRPTHQPNAWAAAPQDAAPRLTLEWPEPQRISRVELSFDTDFDHPMETVLMQHPAAEMPFCVRHSRVRDEAGNLLFEETANHQTRRTIRFAAPVTTRKLAPQRRHSGGADGVAVLRSLTRAAAGRLKSGRWWVEFWESGLNGEV